MKVRIKNFNAVAHWRWNLSKSKPTEGVQDENGERKEEEEDEEDEESEEELCGICRAPFEGCCPDCRIPGDDCPLIWGECTHIFHMHCLLKWIGEESSKQACPMDRRPWVTAGEPTSHVDTTPPEHTDQNTNNNTVGMDLNPTPV